jgi:hypothetical protein
MVLFREPQGNTRILEMRQLTSRSDQVLCVTIDSYRRSFNAAYGTLQAVESVCAWIIADREGANQKLFEMISLKELQSSVELVMKDFERNELTARQRTFLSAKADTVRKLLGTVG